MSEDITQAVLITVNTNYDGVYGGEMLLNRALVASSKAGIRTATIVCQPHQREKIAALIDRVDHRLALHYDIIVLQPQETLGEAVVRVTAQWHGSFLLFATDLIVHPSFLTQARRYRSLDKPLVLAYQHVRVDNDQVTYDGALAEKFRAIFVDPHAFTKISLDISVPHSGTLDLGTVTSGDISPTVRTGIISSDIVVCHGSDLRGIAFSNCAELLQHWRDRQTLAVGFVENAWWLKVTGREQPAQLTAFFWKIAFKEISGEFSKLVNSKMSKPMTFLFVKLGFSPNAISILELLFFLFSSLFLLIPHYWAMIAFAFIWQFAAGVLDRCDGEVARIRNYESEAGGRFDMLIDDLRFALPFLFLTIACLREYALPTSYLVAATATTLWYGTAVICHSRFLRRAGYVSIQTMGQDFFKTQQGAWVKPYRRMQPFVKGDMRTLYLFLLTFLGRKYVLFWTLVVYAWLVGGSYFFTITKFRPPPARVPVGV